jgi:hypothetical protein
MYDPAFEQWLCEDPRACSYRAFDRASAVVRPDPLLPTFVGTFTA